MICLQILALMNPCSKTSSASAVQSLGNHAVIAYDSSTVSTYSGRQNEVRYGYNKAKDGLKAIKLLTLYSIESRQPVAFTNIPAIVHNTERVVYMNEGRNETQMCTQVVTYYIPVTEEGKEYNRAYIKSVQSSNSVYGGSGTSIIEKPDSNNYFVATTYVYYTLSDDSVGESDFYIGINSVAIARNRNPEGSGGYLLGIGTPSVYVRQWGATQGEEERYLTKR